MEGDPIAWASRNDQTLLPHVADELHELVVLLDAAVTDAVVRIRRC